MAGVLWATAAGLGFGLFQIFNRKAGRSMGARVGTFILLLVSALILSLGSLLTVDLPTLLREAPPVAFVQFSLAGLIHFFLGWSLLTISQQRVGAARTGALVGVTPLFATFVAAVALGEFLRLPILAGIGLVVVGVYFVSTDPFRSDVEGAEAGWRASLFGLGTAVCFAISPIFIRGGLEGLPSPLLGVTVGMIACVVAYGFLLPLGRRSPEKRLRLDGAFGFQLLAGAMVGLSTWARWIALDLAPVGVVLALGRLSMPLVLLLAPVLIGAHLEQVTPRIWLGAALIVVGSLLLILYR